MARTRGTHPRTHPRLASLYLLVASTAVVLHADAQLECTEATVTQACDESDICLECTAVITGGSFLDCLAGIDATIGSCEFTEQAACCLNDVSGIDCVGDLATFEFFECVYDLAEPCDESLTCSGDTTPAPAAASGTGTPVAGGGGVADTLAPTPAGTPAPDDGRPTPPLETSAPAATGVAEGTVMPITGDGDRALDITPAPSSSAGAAMPSATTTTSMVGESETMFPTATVAPAPGGPGTPAPDDGRPTPPLETSAPAAAGVAEGTVMPITGDGDRALDITPAPSSSAGAAMPSATTTTSMAGESETMFPTATGDGDRELDITPSPTAGGAAGGGPAPTASDETMAPTNAAGEVGSESVAPTALGDADDIDTTSGGRGLFSTNVGGVVTGLLAFCTSAVAVVV